ncbi:carboxypeptidase-like regulatory domain-containing protein [Flavobacterium piscinae]|uniref:TonB-dependent receptor n=1 Tax=Flavobacterium piscinae TaxID=2506424 RepID=UPI0019A5635F|nr:TonB-dependent receptor [Flavobacterium piscinae]MBC8883384.1 carboxypeptidase-like regulatory domain-containing protein [Flavobacterium piscinae]
MTSSIKSIIYLFHLLFLTTVFSQEFSITGKIIDENKQGIEGSEIVLLSEGNIVNSAITNFEGNFTLKNKPGVYSLRFYFVGTVIYQTDFNLDKNIDLGTLKSFDNSTQLREVEVTSKKRVIENQVDRTVFNVENSIRSTGTDGFELLKATPGVFISGNQIGIVGKSTVSVLIDDKIVNLSGNELINYLRGISSENIKNIEVITTPPAKYDAQGNSGLINIKLKKLPKILGPSIFVTIICKRRILPI